MRIRLRGINSVTKRLADGRVVTYFYAWKGGPKVQGKPGSPEFIASYNAAVAQKLAPPKGVLLTVLHAYQQSQEFIGLAERTRADYMAKVKLIETKFGDYPLSILTDRRTRGEFMAWRDKLAITDEKPWTADGFRSSWRKACAAVRITGLTFNDLRGTAVTRLAIADCTVPQIAAITGHSLRDVTAILDSNYLNRDPAMAETAIRKLEKGAKSSN